MALKNIVQQGRISLGWKVDWFQPRHVNWIYASFDEGVSFPNLPGRVKISDLSTLHYRSDLSNP